MTRTDYMHILAQNLRRLPEEDYHQAIEYFEEYFNEAGPEQEQRAIEDLGSPEDAARELIMNLAERNVQEPPKTVKRGVHAVWIGVLGVCAAPIALPFACVLLCMVFLIVLLFFALLLTLFLCALCTVASGVLGTIGGFFLAFHAFADGVATLGASLFLTGAGILLVYGSFHLCRFALKKTAAALGSITKGGRKHEASH